MDHSQNGPAEPGNTLFQRDFLDVLRALYRRRLLVGFGILAFTVFALLLSFVTPKTYRSTGFFQLSDPYQSRAASVFSVASRFLESSKFLVVSQLKEADMLQVLEVLKDKELPFGEAPNPYILSIQDFKKFSSRYRDDSAFLRFAEKNGELTASELQLLRGVVAGGHLAKWVSGVYALSRDELKDMGRSLENENNFVTGVTARVDAGDRDFARKSLQLLGDYIAFSTLHERINDYIAANLSEFQLLAGRYSNDILHYRDLIRQLETQKQALLELKKKYPGYQNTGGRQLVSLQANGRRYLSIEEQIIGIESRILDLQGLLETFALEKKKAELYLQHFTQCKGLQLNPPGNGPELVDQLKKITERSFAGKLGGEDGAAEVFNTLITDIERFSVLYSQSLRFVSGPTSPAVPVGPRKAVYLVFGLFFGFVVFVPLAIFIEFWKRNKKYIME